MKFSEYLWNGIQDIYNNILLHPFIGELASGCLSKNRFAFYLKQDVLYLNDYARALAMTASKATNVHDLRLCLHFALDSLIAEQDLHVDFLQKLNITPAKEKSVSCFAYTNYLLTTALNSTFAENIAALLPCFWIYREVGAHLNKQLRDPNPYAFWIRLYNSDSFNLAVQKAIDLVDEQSVQVSDIIQDRMYQAFLTASKHEYDFWDEAYQLGV